MALQFTGNRNAKMSSVVAIDWDNVVGKPGVVQYDIDQGLDGTQREQARENIAAVGHDAQTLTATQRRQARANIGAAPVFNIQDYGALASNSAADADRNADAFQEAYSRAVTAGMAAIYIPQGIYRCAPLDLTATCEHITVYGDPGFTILGLVSATGVPFFDCKAGTFKNRALAFKDLWIDIGTASTAAGNIAFDVENRQETVWDSVTIYGFREGIKLTSSWAPVITGTCLFQGMLGKVIYTTDSSFKGARIKGAMWFGNGISLSAPCIELKFATGFDISGGNDFASNYNPIEIGTSSGGAINGNYFELSTIGNIEFVNYSGVSSAIDVTANDMEEAGPTVFKEVDGLNFSNNRLYNWAVTYNSTATRVVQAGNSLAGTASLGEPTYVTSTQPFISSAPISAFSYRLGGGGTQSVLFNSTASGDFTVLRSREAGGGTISIGGATDKTTYYLSDTHTFGNFNGGSQFAQLSNSGLFMRGGRPLSLDGSTSGSLALRAPAIAGTNTITFPAGTTDFTATGGASRVLRQSSAGGAITVSQLDASDVANTWRILAASGVQASLTGSTSETALATISIPANAMGANGIVKVTAMFSGTNSANNKIYRVRWGGIGGTQFTNTTVTTTPASRMECEIHNRNATNSQIGNVFLAAGGFGSGGTVTTAAVDTTSAVDLVLTGQLANSGETITLESYTVEIVNRS